MSAIFGFWQLDGRPLAEGPAAAMGDALAGCGPHGGGVWRGEAIALGARLLHDTPEAVAERQPLVGRSGDVLVADVRLDNREELLAVLEVPRGVGGERADGAILLAAWERWGEACCARLEGDFAFAVWSPRERTLFCARDGLGVKPLYLHHREGRLFAFSSQIAGLLALAEVPRRLDRTMAADHLVARLDERERTLFAEVSRLLPGHHLTVAPGVGASRRQYWSPAPLSGLRLPSDEAWFEALRDRLELAVRSRLRAAGGVGAHLSGGLDSSAVVCLAARELPAGGQLTALSFSEPGGEGATSPDAGFIAEVVRFAGVEIHHSTFDVDGLEHWFADTAPGAMAPEYETAATHRWARDRGLRVVLTGWGGDEGVSFGGHGVLASLLVRGRWLAARRVLDALRHQGVAPRGRRYLLRRALDPLLPDPIWHWVARRVWRDPLAARIRFSCVSPGLAEEVGLEQRLRQRLARELIGARANQIALLAFGNLVARMERWSADASRFGLDYRHPLLDRRLLELCLALPEKLHIQSGLGRYPFRRALEGRVPETVLRRPDKADSWQGVRAFGAPRDEASAALFNRVLERLEARGNDLGGCLDLVQMRRCVERIGAGGESAAGPPRWVSFASASLAVRLALFVERHRLDV